jgi:GNAT superfamily N-acetyltransferase
MNTSDNPDSNSSDAAEPDPVIVRVATKADAKYALMITTEMADSAKARGSGIGHRSVEFLCQKMDNGEAVIAVTQSGTWVGFCYIETWQDGQFVSNSGMIVSPRFRRRGIATEIKKAIFQLCRLKYPQASIFSITTGLAIMKLNTRMGFEPVTYSEITTDPQFWNKCKNCVNYDTLQAKGCKNCFCTAMIFQPDSQQAHLTEAE